MNHTYHFKVLCVVLLGFWQNEREELSHQLFPSISFQHFANIQGVIQGWLEIFEATFPNSSDCSTRTGKMVRKSIQVYIPSEQDQGLQAILMELTYLLYENKIRWWFD